LEEETLLIAPCGMNCGICRAYLRKEKSARVAMVTAQA
jgi:hypothetical protein